MKEWLVRRARLMLNNAPSLKRKLHKTANQLHGRRAYRHRARAVSRLMDKYGIKPQSINGPRHVIFIVVDSLRKDHLSLYGYKRKTTPFLESLAQDAAVFENAVTASPWTYPAVVSMLTGLYPHNHGAVHPQNPRDFDKEYPNKVCQDILALPEVLTALEFESHFISAIATAALPITGWFRHPSVFFAGIDHHLGGALKWLTRNKEKLSFIYCQIADLHPPINIPEPYRDTFGKIPDIPKLETWEFREHARSGEPTFERYRENRVRLYDCALRFVDHQIAKFFEYLREAKLLDSCLIFITSDHGEEFWDHVELERELFYDPRGFYGVGHGHNLFQETINVPLMCVGSGLTPGRYSHNVSLVDLVPTVLDLYGIEHELLLDGCNLFVRRKERTVLSEGIAYGYEKKAIVNNNWKLIHSEGDKVSLLFELSKDPKEKHDLAQIKTEELQRLKAMLPEIESKGQELEVDKKTKEQLRNLGYI